MPYAVSAARWRGAVLPARRQVSNRCPLHACAAPATAASLVRAQPPDRRPRRCQGLLLVLLVGSAGRPALALPAPGGGVLGKLGVRDAGAWAGVRRPRQSYEVAGGAAVATLPRSGLLVAQRLTGVVRCVPPLPPTSCPRQQQGRFCTLLKRLFSTLMSPIYSLRQCHAQCGCT
jgi:hypothetical protein